MAVGIDSTKARILEAAGTIFAQKGFETATIREICHAAGANLAAVNYHFGDKQRLYLEAVKHAHCSRAEEVPLPEWDAATVPEVKLTEFIGVLLKRMLGAHKVPWHLQLMLREVVRPSIACEDLVRDYIRPHFEVLKAILRDLLPEDVSDDTLALTAFSVIGQCLFYRLTDPVVRMLLSGDQFERLTPELLAEHISAVMLAALGLRLPVGAAEDVR
jgi:TetR/AcrR family transcriptional regulator, regulator of cefoperazone and chloramphenicol sensitivity